MATTQSRDKSAFARELAEKGVVSVENYLDDETCDEIKEEVISALENDEFEVDDGTLDVDKMAASRTILDRRGGKGGRDEGMLDIFNIDETIPATSDIKHDDFIHDIINSAGDREYVPENTNIYYNRSVTNTRGYHFDSYDGQYKAFVYLTDVPDESYGPYSYIEGTHDRPMTLKRMIGVFNRLRGRPPTDAVMTNDSAINTFTAPKGTLIISDQTGYHRGIPQQEGKERMLISSSLGSV